MKALLCFLFIASSAFAQDPATYLKNFDSKVYSLKNKGIQDFVVDIESSKLTKQLNDQQLFGKIDEVIFRTYWTAKPERLAIEIIGMPDGFKEVKEELKASMLQVMDNLLPQTFEQRFAGYKFGPGEGPKEIKATDTTGVAGIPTFILKFDAQDKLTEVTGSKPVGTFVVKPTYGNESFAGSNWVLTGQKTTSSENGQTMTIEKELDYGKVSGIGVLTEVEITTTQTLQSGKPSSSSETINFKNYKINEGLALKYFLGESSAEGAAKKP